MIKMKDIKTCLFNHVTRVMKSHCRILKNVFWEPTVKRSNRFTHIITDAVPSLCEQDPWLWNILKDDILIQIIRTHIRQKVIYSTIVVMESNDLKSERYRYFVLRIVTTGLIFLYIQIMLFFHLAEMYNSSLDPQSFFLFSDPKNLHAENLKVN